MYGDRSAESGHDASTSATDDTNSTRQGGVSRRRLLAATAATIATAGLAGCSGVLGGDGGGDGNSTDGDSGGGGMANVQNEVSGIEITDVTRQSNSGRFTLMVSLENTGGEDTGVLDFDYVVTLYDASGSQIEMMGTSAANRDGFYDGDSGTVQVTPQTQASASDIDSYELVVRCDDGPYCQ